MTIEETPLLRDEPDEWALPETDEERASGGFRLVSDRMLAWAMRKASDVRAERAQHEYTAQVEIDRVQRWHSRVDARLARDAEFFEAVIGDYARRVRAVDEDRKTLSTPYGTVSTKTVRGKWEVDQAAVVGWAKTAAPELVTTKVTESVAVADLKAALEVAEEGPVHPETGQVVPGVKVLPDDISVTVRLDTDRGVS